jgi:hypothetical protein
MIWYDILTAIGLTPGGSSTHINTNKQYIEQQIIDTKQNIEQQLYPPIHVKYQAALKSLSLLSL